MCQRCNYPDLIEAQGLDPTPNRVRIMEVIGNNPSPIRAQEIFTTVRRTAEINRVTVYRILDLLVEKGLVARLERRGPESGLRHRTQRKPPGTSSFPLQELRCPAMPAARQPEGGRRGLSALVCRRDSGGGRSGGRDLQRLPEKGPCPSIQNVPGTFLTFNPHQS